MPADIYNEDFLCGVSRIGDATVDLVVADPPYGLGKNYGNDSDLMPPDEFMRWNGAWLDAVLPKMKPNASLYLFASWRKSPELFSLFKTRLTMLNEIIWDRKVPSMGGSNRRYSSVHDNIGFFVAGREYYFDADAVRIPYDAATLRARSRKRHAGARWLTEGRNPTDVWHVARLHKSHRERTGHPTQKPLSIIRRMVLASCPRGGLVLDPFAGSGTTAEAAVVCGRDAICFELNPIYCQQIRDRLAIIQPTLIL